jgi:hypothetical protein
MYAANVTNRQVIVNRLEQVAAVTFINSTRQNVNDITAHQTRLSVDKAMPLQQTRTTMVPRQQPTVTASYNYV